MIFSRHSFHRLRIATLYGALALSALSERTFATVLVGAVAPVPLAAFAPVPARAHAQDAPAPESAVQRWRELSPAERERLRQRYEHYRALSDAEKFELGVRAHHLKETCARVQRELPRDAHERLGQLSPERQRELVRDLVQGEARDVGARIRGRLPEEWVAKLEKASPEERAQFLVDFKRHQRGRMLHFSLQEFGRRLNLPQEEIDRYKALPQDERRAKVFELRKRVAGIDAQDHGLPPGITPAEWDAWQDLPPEQFFLKMTEHSRRQSRGREPGEVAAEGDREFARMLAPEEALARLAEAVRVRPDEVIDLAELTPEERHTRIFETTRARALAIIVAERLLPPERIQEIATASPPIFFAHVRRLLSPLHLRSRPMHVPGYEEPRRRDTPAGNPLGGDRDPGGR